MTRGLCFLVTVHRLFSLGNHRLNTSGLELQQRFFRSRVSALEIAPGGYLWAYQQSTSCELVPSCWSRLGFSFAQLPKSFTISQPTKKHCKPKALVSQSLEARIYVFNYLPLVLQRLYDPSVLGVSHSTDILTNQPLWYLPPG